MLEFEKYIKVFIILAVLRWACNELAKPHLRVIVRGQQFLPKKCRSGSESLATLEPHTSRSRDEGVAERPTDR